MSNPAVIVLAKTQTKMGLFQIEDNLGESIHLHLGEIRCDLTIKEFNELSIAIGKALEAFMEIDGFKLNKFSMEFLLQLAEKEWLPNLIALYEDKIRLSEICVDTYNFIGYQSMKPLPYSRVIKALNGDTRENDLRKERNYYGQSNQERANEMLESIKKNGYPYNGKMLVFLKGNNIIHDGQHRAACMYHLYGDREIPILRLEFSNSRYGVPTPLNDYLWVLKDKAVFCIRYLFKIRKNAKNWLNLKKNNILCRWDKYRFNKIV